MVGASLTDMFDTYSRHARFYPGAIVMSPITLLAVVPLATKPTWWSGVLFISSASGVTYFGAQIVRSAGRREEARLWASWGGAPTTQMLRFRNAENQVAVARRHAQLTRLLPDLQLPNEIAESTDPKAADQYYETAVKTLIARTRNKERFARVFDELCQYGFRRNLWGCRKPGLWLAALGLALTAALGFLALLTSINISISGLLVAAIADVLLLAALYIVVTPDWVRETAEAYALQLISSLEDLASTES